MFIPRRITTELEEALSTSPVTFLNGARQTGKSTLARWIAKEYNFKYITLDDITALDSARKDPRGFLLGTGLPLIIDEMQKAPQLMPAIKKIVDDNRRAGTFLLTGSANVLTLPRLSESLAGRMELITLWPFSCAEIAGQKLTIIDRLFAKSFSPDDLKVPSEDNLIGKIMAGGYPEIQKLKTDRRRNAWFNSYITTILQRDVRDLANIERLAELPRLLALVAANSGSLVNMSSLSRDAGLVMMTLKRYLALLEMVFLIKRLPAWFRNVGKRLLKAPKIYLTDTGLLSHLAGLDQNRFASVPTLLGKMIESFVMQELFKQASWSETLPGVYYYRTTSGVEVDFILENRAGAIVGIEVKAGSKVTSTDFKGLKEVQELVGPSFVRGVILYSGEKTIAFGNELFAVPLQALWG